MSRYFSTIYWNHRIIILWLELYVFILSTSYCTAYLTQKYCCICSNCDRLGLYEEIQIIFGTVSLFTSPLYPLYLFIIYATIRIRRMDVLSKAKVKTNLTDKQVREKFILSRPCRGESKSPRFYHFCLQQFMQLSFSLFLLVLLHRFLGLPSCSRNAKTVNSKSCRTQKLSYLGLLDSLQYYISILG